MPQDIHFLTDLDQLKVVADPLRQRILVALCERERTTAQLAEAIDAAPSNLYYHVNRLRDAGLIELVRTQPKRGAVEKYYRAVAQRYEVAPNLLANFAEDTGFAEVVAGMIETALGEFNTSMAAGLVRLDADGQNALVARAHIKGDPEEIAAMRERLEDALTPLEHDPEATPEDAVTYSSLVLFFPLKN